MKNKFIKLNLTILFCIVFLFSAAQAQTVDAGAKMPLSAEQMQLVKGINDKAAREAAPLAAQLAVTVKQIYENMLADQPSEKVRKKLSRQMTELTGKIVLIKGQTIRETVNILTPEQKARLKAEMKKPGAPADLSELMTRIFDTPKQ